MTRSIAKAKRAAKTGTGMGAASDLLTAGKLAAAWGVKPGDVKKAIVAAGVKPDAVRCGCAYYGRGTVASIKKALEKG